MSPWEWHITAWDIPTLEFWQSHELWQVHARLAYQFGGRDSDDDPPLVRCHRGRI